jgi:hypothetical protein
MLNAICDCVQCAVCGVRHFNSCSVRQCAQQSVAVRTAVCGFPAVWQCAAVRAAVCRSAAVCGSAHGCVRQCVDVCVRQCTWQCAAVRTAGYGSACGSVQLPGG